MSKINKVLQEYTYGFWMWQVTWDDDKQLSGPGFATILESLEDMEDKLPDPEFVT